MIFTIIIFILNKYIIFINFFEICVYKVFQFLINLFIVLI